jgi:hypothetical protein
VCDAFGSIVGGSGNTTSGLYSFIGGGFNNIINSGTTSAILAGSGNTINSTGSTAFIVGANITADRSCTTFVNNLSIKNIPTSSSGLPSGSIWSNSGVLNIVP